MLDTNGNYLAPESTSYQIVVKGQLDPSWAEWFDNLTITTTKDAAGNTTSTLIGLIPDQAALYGIIARLRDLGLTLLEIHKK